MKKVTKILSIVLVIALVMTMSVVLFACGDESSNTQDNSPEKALLETPVNFTLKVADWNGTSLLDKKVSLKYVDDTPLTVLKDNANVVENNGWLISINNSLIFPEYSLMTYVNGQMAMDALANLDLKENDVVEIKNEAYTMRSEAEVAVGNALIKYYTEKAPAKYAAQTTTAQYWDEIAMILMANQYKPLTNMVASDEYKEYLTNYDYSKPGTDAQEWGRLYYALKANNMSMDKFKEAYKTYYEGITSYNKPNYIIPFELMPAKALGLKNTVVENAMKAYVIHNDISDFGEYGKGIDDSEAWMAALLNNYKAVDKSEFSYYYTNNIANQYDIAATLVACAANGVNLVKEQAELDVDYFETLRALIGEDGYIKSSPGFEDQLYASILAYTISRANADYKTGNYAQVNIFAL